MADWLVTIDIMNGKYWARLPRPICATAGAPGLAAHKAMAEAKRLGWIKRRQSVKEIRFDVAWIPPLPADPENRGYTAKLQHAAGYQE